MKCHLVTKAQFQPTLKNLTRHYTYTYIYYSLFLFFFSTFVPLLTPSSDKTLPTRGSEVYCKKRTSRRVNESILEPPPSLPSQTDHPLPLKNALRERERERERNSTWDFCLPSLALVAIESTWSIDEKFRDDQSWTRQRTGQFLFSSNSFASSFSRPYTFLLIYLFQVFSFLFFARSLSR